MIKERKIIYKSKLDALIDIEREHANTPYSEGRSGELCDIAIKAAHEIEATTADIHWLYIKDFVSSIFFGLRKNAPNALFYAFLETMGWVIVDDCD